MLLHYQGMSINVERQLLAVNGDKDGARNIVSNLLTECVHVVISEVVMSMIHTRDDQTTSGHFALNLGQCHLHHGGKGCVDVQHGDAVHVLHGVAASSNLGQ